MALDDSIRERVILVGGKVAGVDCPECGYDRRDREFDAYSVEPVSCPDCGTTILSETQKDELRRTGKL